MDFKCTILQFDGTGPHCQPVAVDVDPGAVLGQLGMRVGLPHDGRSSPADPLNRYSVLLEQAAGCTHKVIELVAAGIGHQAAEMQVWHGCNKARQFGRFRGRLDPTALRAHITFDQDGQHEVCFLRRP